MPSISINKNNLAAQLKIIGEYKSHSELDIAIDCDFLTVEDYQNISQILLKVDLLYFLRLRNSNQGNIADVNLDAFKIFLKTLSSLKVLGFGIDFADSPEKLPLALENNFYSKLFTIFIEHFPNSKDLSWYIPNVHRNIAINEFIKFIRENKLSLEGVRLHADPDAQGAFAAEPEIMELFKALCNIKTLVVLELVGFDFSNPKLTEAFKNILTTVELNSLYLGGPRLANNINGVQYKILLQAVQQCKTLESFHVLNLDDYHEVRLESLLSTKTGNYDEFVFDGMVQYLIGDECQIQSWQYNAWIEADRELVELNSILSRNRSLALIDLPSYCINSRNVTNLITALKSNPVLTKIEFDSLVLSEEHGKKFLDFLKKKRKNLIIVIQGLVFVGSQLSHLKSKEQVAFSNTINNLHEIHQNKVYKKRDLKYKKEKTVLELQIRNKKIRTAYANGKGDRLQQELNSQRNMLRKMGKRVEDSSPVTELQSPIVIESGDLRFHGGDTHRTPENKQEETIVEHSLTQEIKEMLAKDLERFNSGKLGEEQLSPTPGNPLQTVESVLKPIVSAATTEDKIAASFVNDAINASSPSGDITTSQIASSDLNMLQASTSKAEHAGKKKNQKQKRISTVVEVEMTNEDYGKHIQSVIAEIAQLKNELEKTYEFIKKSIDYLKDDLRKRPRELFAKWNDKQQKLNTSISSLDIEVTKIIGMYQALKEDSENYRNDLEQIYTQAMRVRNGLIARLKSDYNNDNIQLSLTNALGAMESLLAHDTSKSQQANDNSEQTENKPSNGQDAKNKSSHVQPRKEKNSAGVQSQKKTKNPIRPPVASEKDTATNGAEVKKEAQKTKVVIKNKNLFLSRAFKNLIKIAHVQITTLEENTKDKSETAKPLTTVSYFSLLYLLLRAYTAFHNHRRMMEGSTDIQHISEVMRNVILRYNNEELNNKSIFTISKAIFPSVNLPKNFLELPKKALFTQPFTTAQIADLIKVFQLGTAWELVGSQFILDIKNAAIYEKLREFHSVRAAFDLSKDEALSYLNEQIIPKMKRIYAEIEMHYPKIPTPDQENDFYHRYFRHIDALKMMMVICGEFSQGFEDNPFWQRCANIRKLVIGEDPDCSYATVRDAIKLIVISETKEETPTVNDGKTSYSTGFFPKANAQSTPSSADDSINGDYGYIGITTDPVQCFIVQDPIHKKQIILEEFYAKSIDNSGGFSIFGIGAGAGLELLKLACSNAENRVLLGKEIMIKLIAGCLPRKAEIPVLTQWLDQNQILIEQILLRGNLFSLVNDEINSDLVPLLTQCQTYEMCMSYIENYLEIGGFIGGCSAVILAKELHFNLSSWGKNSNEDKINCIIHIFIDASAPTIHVLQTDSSMPLNLLYHIDVDTTNDKAETATMKPLVSPGFFQTKETISDEKRIETDIIALKDLIQQSQLVNKEDIVADLTHIQVLLSRYQAKPVLSIKNSIEIKFFILGLDLAQQPHLVKCHENIMTCIKNLKVLRDLEFNSGKTLAPHYSS